MAIVLAAAGRAPSLHNTQPWRFVLGPDALELHADPTRQLAVVDPDGRAVRLACGAALANVRLALLGFGVRATVAIRPDPDRPELLAIVTRGGGAKPTLAERELLAAVAVRSSNRHPFSDAPVGRAAASALQGAARSEGCVLHLVTDPDRVVELQDVARRAHRAQGRDPELQAERARWTGVPEDRRDGVPASATVLPHADDPWVAQDLTGGQVRDRLPGKDFEERPLVAVLEPSSAGPSAEVCAGQALERVLLTATALGLSASMLSHTVDVPETREQVRRLVGARQRPVMVLRLGYGWPVPRSGRRDPGDLVGP